MVRFRTAPLAAGLFGLLVLAGCQHTHKHNNGCCPCSCQSAPTVLPVPATPAVTPVTPAQAEPTARLTVPGNPLQIQ